MKDIGPILTRYLFRGLLALGLACAGLWAFGAMWFQGPAPAAARIAIGGALAAIFLVCAVLVLLGHVRRIWPSAAILMLGLAIWWAGIKPSDTHEWTPDARLKPLIRLNGDAVEVRNVRNFTWSAAETPDQQRWETRTYSRAGIETLDLFLSTWGDPDIAHVILSFGFAGGQHLAFSIEIRKQSGEEYYTLAGLFRRYELLLAAADEADIIKVRANRRNETVHRYAIDAKPENIRRLFDKYVALAQRLEAAPEFYNTLTSNCTTLLFGMLRDLDANAFPFDRRVLISGRVPDYLYDIGFIARDQPLATVKQRADITQASKAAETTSDYSAAIRR